MRLQQQQQHWTLSLTHADRVYVWRCLNFISHFIGRWLIRIYSEWTTVLSSLTPFCGNRSKSACKRRKFSVDKEGHQIACTAIIVDLYA